MRRPFFSPGDTRLWPFEVMLLRIALALLARLYDANGASQVEEIREEHGHFYRDETFLPTGHRVRIVPDAVLEDPGTLRAEIARNALEGVDLVMRSGGFLVNLSNVDPVIGHCTAVRVGA
jgi:hypothetical protein